MIDTVLHGNSLEILKTLPDNSVDSIVTDPPAGISFMGKDWDNPDTFPTRDRKNGQGSTFGKSMTNGPEWSYNKRAREGFISFLREVMTEALRVLKPGGHALIWALPRTSHWTATALEDAGFEVRDKLYHLFGSGFPKSTAIDKQIDKMLGKEREVIGVRSSYRPNSGALKPKDGFQDRSSGLETKPATPEAQRWQGYGTALKPSVEEWILCRKPLAESSIAAQVLATGTGGLNIAQTRVGSEATLRKAKGGGYDGGWKPLDVSGSTQGRFPSHLLLSHSLWCIPRGTKRVRGHGGGWNGKGNTHDETQWRLNNPDGISRQNADGYEHVEAYDCAPDCPIAELDRQSGVRKSGARVNKIGTVKPEHNLYGAYTRRTHSEYEASEGGASRYFTNFPPDDYTPYRYIPKASRAERNKGCEDLPEGTKPSTVYLNNRRCRNCGKQQVSGSPCQCDTPDWEIIERGKPLYQLRDDLTPEQREYVEMELAKIGGAF